MSKLKFFLLLLLLPLCSLTTYAYDFEADGIYYNILSPSEVSVTYGGDGWWNGYDCPEHVIIPSQLSHGGTIYSVISIGDFAFYNCTSLMSVVIPNSITSIGQEAFEGCIKMTSAEIPNSVTEIAAGAFLECSNLTSVKIPDALTYIGWMTFKGCANLRAIEIPNSVKYIYEEAFSGCTSLITAEIPNSVIYIGEKAFFRCTSLTSVDIPDSVNKIESDTFSVCTSLRSVTIPNTVTSIGYAAFFHCTSLTSVEIPNSVIKIENWAFGDCTNLRTVTIPNTVTSIGSLALGNCSNLETVWVHWENPDLVSTPSDLFNYCESIREATLFVPIGTREKYQNLSPWDQFKEILEYNENSRITSAKTVDVVIKTINGHIQICGTELGESIQLYDINGMLLDSIKVNDGETTIHSNLEHGQTYIVRYGDKAIKYKF